MKILILSPHMDDAVFSCCDYGLKLLQSRHQIKVLTIFTEFSLGHLPKYTTDYIAQSGFSSTKDFKQARQKENMTALNLLGFDSEELHFIDGGFRKHNKDSIYKTSQELFLGAVSRLDNNLLFELTTFLDSIHSQYDSIISPLGIGNHADHLITRYALEKTVPKNKLRYYVDFPYALSKQNWKPKYLLSLLKTKRLLFPSSEKKLEACRAYGSQYALLFKKTPLYPEIILW